MGKDRHILVGVITGAHGVRGEVKLRSFTEDPAAIARYGPLLAPDGRTFEIASLRPGKDGFVARLSGLDSRDAAEALRGTELSVPRSRLPEEEGSYYHADLVGLVAGDASGKRLGTVAGIRNYGAGDLVEIAMPDGRTALVPFTQACVPEVDLAGGRMVLDPPEGLLDD